MVESSKREISRKPDADVRRRLRQEVGFCCPIDGCGSPYLDYHHFDPPFSVDKHHNPAGMIALCPTHHRQADAGAFTIEQIRALKVASGKVVTGRFNWLRQDLLVVGGGNFYYQTHRILNYQKKDLIYFRRDEEKNLLLNIEFPDSSSVTRALVQDNDWVSDSSPTDLESPPGGKELRIKYANGDRILVHFNSFDTADDLEKKYKHVSRTKWEGVLSFPLTTVEVQLQLPEHGISISAASANFPSRRISISGGLSHQSPCCFMV